MDSKFTSRINYSGDLKLIIDRALAEYNLPISENFEIVKTGFEDLNIKVKSDRDYFIKIFSSTRTEAECIQYLDIVNKAIKANISTPSVLVNKSGSSLTKIENINLALFEYIDGRTIPENFEFSDEQIRFLANQCLSVSNLIPDPSHLKPLYDSWAVVNFRQEYPKKVKLLDIDLRKVINPILGAFGRIKLDTLPKSFVHGDIRKINVLVDNANKLWITDFGVSNTYPRIVEPAVILSNLLFFPDDIEKSKNYSSLFLEEYTKLINLSDEEKSYIPTFTKMQWAMNILSANYEQKENKDNSTEINYWIETSKKGIESGIY